MDTVGLMVGLAGHSADTQDRDGAVNDENVHTVDLLPTLAAVASCKVATDRLIGMDQFARLTGESKTPARKGFPA